MVHVQNKQEFTMELEQTIINKLLKILLAEANYFEKPSSLQDINFIHYKKIEFAIKHQRKIQMILPAFPAKSNNREKTHSHLPDLGEVESLRRLNNMAIEMARYYQPGVEIIICSDGRVFSDLVGVTEHEVSQYRREIKNIIQQQELDHIALFDLEDVYPANLDYDLMRFFLEKDFAQELSSIKDNIKKDPKELAMFNGIHRFIKEDYLVIKNDLSKNQVSKLAKEISYKVIQRSNAWSRLLEKKFPLALRLSIHPQSQDSKKFPIKLLPSNSAWSTPWHRVLVKQAGKIFLMRADEAKSKGALLRKFMDKYAYFELEQAV